MLTIIRDTAESMGVKVYVVGEYVRYCFLDRRNNQIEIVVEGDGLEFGRIIILYTFPNQITIFQHIWRNHS